jgi:hypothetical protein
MAELNDEDLRTLRETYGLVQRLDQRMTDHVEWSSKMSGVRTEQLKDLNDRLKPVEEFHGDFKKALKLSTFIGLPVVAAAGALFSEGLKKIVKSVVGVHP